MCTSHFVLSSCLGRDSQSHIDSMEPSKHMRVSPVPQSVSMGPLSDREMSMAAGLLARAVSHGQQQHLAKTILGSLGGKSLAVASQTFLENMKQQMPGAMSDGAKRLRDPELEEWDSVTETGHESPAASACAGCVADAAYSRGSLFMEMPVPFPDKSPMFNVYDEDLSVPLPQDVSSVTEWAQTELKLQKVADKNLTYAGFLQEAKDDRALQQYGKFIIDSFGPRAKNKKTVNYTHGVDFAFFLSRVRPCASQVSRRIGRSSPKYKPWTIHPSWIEGVLICGCQPLSSHFHMWLYPRSLLVQRALDAIQTAFGCEWKMCVAWWAFGYHLSLDWLHCLLPVPQYIITYKYICVWYILIL